MSRDELKPCPFCGSKAAIKESRRYPSAYSYSVKAYSVVCTNYDCIIGYCDDRYRLHKKEVIEAWNRRTNNEQR